MTKKWVTVLNHKDHKIQALSVATSQVDFGYKIEPALPGEDGFTYTTIQNAVNSIDNAIVVGED